MSAIKIDQPGQTFPNGRPARLVILLGVLIIAAVTFGTALLVFIDRARTIAEAKSNLRSLALVLGEQVERSFQSVDVVQSSAIQRLQEAGLMSNDMLKKLGSDSEWHDILKDLVDTSPNIHALGLIDENGTMVNTSEDWPGSSAGIADRAYFQQPRDDPKLTTYISEPILNRMTGVWTVFVSRRLTSSEGRFVGVLTASILLSDLERFYRSISSIDHRAIALFRRDGILLARYPRVDAALGKVNVGQAPIFQTLKSCSEVVLQQKSLVDGADRYIAAVALDKFQLVVSASDTVAVAQAPWRHQASQMIGVALLMDLAVATAGFLAIGRIRASEELAESQSYLARHDIQTDLPNRLFFNEQIENLSVRFAAEGKKLAVLIIDIDHFKEVNDTLGHPVGDDLLRAAGDRLHAFLRPQDVVARLGSDEFAVIRVDAAGIEEVESLARELIARFGDSFAIADHQITISISIGAALLPADGVDPDRLLRRADLALYCAKSNGRQSFRFFLPGMEAQLYTRRALEIELRRTLARNGFELAYQPLLNLHSNRVEGFEALLRWKHPDRGYVPTCEFIPVAEDTCLIGPLGAWVLSTACAQAATWPASIRLSVNLSPVQFRVRNVVHDVTQALQTSGLAPSRLELEITESVLLEDNSVAGEALHQLKALGISIALDDFGTGYSSLSYLRKFPFDKIKIDRSFVQELETSRDCAAIIRTTLMLAHQLGMKTTAEGIEKIEQLDILRTLGCAQAQGFLISRPLSSEGILPFLRSKTSHLEVVA